MTTVYLGTDHGGYELKNAVKTWLSAQGYQVEDCGAVKFEPDDDYPDFAFAVADQVSQHPGSRGVVFCRSSVGVIIAANKVKGIRAGSAASPEAATQARQHNDINVLGIAGDWLDLEQAKSVIQAFLETSFTHEERHVRRIHKIEARENNL